METNQSSPYEPNPNRYEQIPYSYCGHSGLMLPRMSLGLWHNFGSVDSFSNARSMLRCAFDHGITHFDMANNYGPEPGSAEINFGKIFKEDFASHRDELILSSKAGHEMWQGPYGNGSSRKNLMASMDQSLKRTGLDYFDIFYSHRYDGVTPIEETMQALIDMVHQGKALYVGISKYPPQEAKKAYQILREAGVPCLVSQYRYNMFERTIEAETLPLAQQEGSGVVVFSPLAQGLLTGKYNHGIPSHSRASRTDSYLKAAQITGDKIAKVEQLEQLANERGQTVTQLSLSWILRDERITSIIIGASKTEQIESNLMALNQPSFTKEELERIDLILAQ